VRPAAALALALAARAAGAATLDGTQAVDAFSPLALGSDRIVGLGGAYAGIAEGVSGIPANPAAVAHRRRELRRRWDVGGSLSWFVSNARQDVDNDGAPDTGLAGVQHAQVGLGLQLGRLGLGLLARSRLATSRPADGGSVGIETAQLYVAGGWSAMRDALVLGAALESTQGSLVLYGDDGKEYSRLRYQSAIVSVGALWRPRALPLRLGATFSPASRARTTDQRLPDAPSAFAFPWTASLGAALWLGPNAARMNEPPAVALAAHPEWAAAPAWEDVRTQPVLLAAQLTIAGPTANAVSAASALGDPGSARTSGARASVVPRVGAEWECWPDRLRLRGGSYLEPSRTGAGPRLHGALGAEVRVRVFSWDLQVGVSGDVAARYQNVGVSVWFWDRLGPLAPAAAPPPVPTTATPP
jgi:hypothetical protein